MSIAYKGIHTGRFVKRYDTPRAQSGLAKLAASLPPNHPILVMVDLRKIEAGVKQWMKRPD